MRERDCDGDCRWKVEKAAEFFLDKGLERERSVEPDQKKLRRLEREGL